MAAKIVNPPIGNDGVPGLGGGGIASCIVCGVK